MRKKCVLRGGSGVGRLFAERTFCGVVEDVFDPGGRGIHFVDKCGEAQRTTEMRVKKVGDLFLAVDFLAPPPHRLKMTTNLHKYFK